MDTQQTSILQKEILAEINDKQLLIQSGKDELIELQHSAPDPVDESSANERQEFIVNQNKRLTTEINMLKQALNNIKSEDFGYCEDCGIEIGFKRLKARPSATTCIDCEKIRENQNRHKAA